MLPFVLSFSADRPIYEQVVYAAKKAIVSGRLKPGDRFPSVRQLSQELRINPNTAQKVVATLTEEGLLEIRPGLFTLVARNQGATSTAGRQALHAAAERLVVESMRYSTGLGQIHEAIDCAWRKLNNQHHDHRNPPTS
ncbi:MAG: GntR family transcriptional regulator [Verrucomicrobiota bacterium]